MTHNLLTMPMNYIIVSANVNNTYELTCEKFVNDVFEIMLIFFSYLCVVLNKQYTIINELTQDFILTSMELLKTVSSYVITETVDFSYDIVEGSSPLNQYLTFSNIMFVILMFVLIKNLNKLKNNNDKIIKYIKEKDEKIEQLTMIIQENNDMELIQKNFKQILSNTFEEILNNKFETFEKKLLTNKKTNEKELKNIVYNVNKIIDDDDVRIQKKIALIKSQLVCVGERRAIM